jgi:nucleotide-binding universal stress UspA family protein
MFKRMIVGVDGRQGGRDALALAALLQGTAGGAIVAVRVYAYDRSVRLGDAEAAGAMPQEDLLTKLEAEVRASGARACAVIARDLSPARALHSVAEREAADLLIVGSCHRAGAERVLAGDNAVSALHGSPCAVAVAPRGYAERPHELRLIGVGFDGSHGSHEALRLACRMAEGAGAYVRATTAVQPPTQVLPTTALYPGWTVARGSARRRAEEMLEHAIADVRDRVTPEVAVGKPWQILSTSSGDLDLLIVGSRAFGPLRRVMLGSTSTHLFHAALCPVLVLPRRAAAPDDPTESWADDVAHAR